MCPQGHHMFKIWSGIFLVVVVVVVVVVLVFFIVVTNGNGWINWTWIKTCPPLEGIFLSSFVLIVVNNLLR